MPTTPGILYLHGFASSPESARGAFFRRRLAEWGIDLHVPDLNTPDFANLLLSSMIERIREEIRACPHDPVFLIGSSLGATAALHFMDRFRREEAARVGRILLLGPSYDFVENRFRDVGEAAMLDWKRTGSHPFYHNSYEKDVDVHYGLIEDLAQYETARVEVEVPILIFHGSRDETVPCEQSVKFARSRRNVRLVVLDSDHQLADQLDTVWSGTVEFFDLCGFHGRGLPVRTETFDLANPGDTARFDLHREAFWSVLEAAYQSRSHTREQHLDRIYSVPHKVFLAFADAPERTLVGCSYVRMDGKRGATAVLPEFQGRGVGRQLICASLQHFRHQVSEIDVAALAMEHLLLSSGFVPVNSEETLKRHLGTNLKRLRATRRDGDRLVYHRRSQLCPDVEKTFVMYEHNALPEVAEPA